MSRGANAISSRSLAATEQASSTLEQKFYSPREGLVAYEFWAKGCGLIDCINTKDLFFAGLLLANQRINDNISGCAHNSEEIGDRVQGG